MICRVMQALNRRGRSILQQGFEPDSEKYFAPNGNPPIIGFAS